MSTTANYQAVSCVKCHRRIEMLEPVDVNPVCSECEEIIKCLWCENEFNGITPCYEFCAPCLEKLKECEKIIDKETTSFVVVSLIESLELVLTNVEIENTLTNLEDN